MNYYDAHTSAIFRFITSTNIQDNDYTNFFISGNIVAETQISGLINTIIIKDDILNTYDEHLYLRNYWYNIEQKHNMKHIHDNWYRVDIQHPNRYMSIDTLPEKALYTKVFINASFVDVDLNEKIRHDEIAPEIKLDIPIEQYTFHINSLEINTTKPLTHISWSGVKNPRFRISTHGIKIFEIADDDTHIALEILCGGKSEYYLGSVFNTSRIDNLTVINNGVETQVRLVNDIK